jgi:UDP-N-acetylglucosamine transferase subunit ALG13
LIFVTLGTQAFQFDRLLRALDGLPGDEELVIQCGKASFRPARAVWFDQLSYEDLVDRVQRARVVVCHAGVGSVLTALEHGRRPVVVPRLHAHGEAVDDHQLPFARRLAQAGLLTLVEDLDALADALAHPEPPAEHREAGGGLAADLRTYLEAVVPRYSR